VHYCNSCRQYLKYYCKHCKQFFRDDKSLTQHVKAEHSFYCSTCDRHFKNQQGLQQHEKAKHVKKEKKKGGNKKDGSSRGERVRNCPLCEGALKNWDLLKKHLMIVHFHAFYCETCKRVFKNESSLLQHVKTSHPAFCNACKRSFKDKRALDQHKKNKHGKNMNQQMLFTITPARSKVEIPDEGKRERIRKIRELREMARDR